MILLARLASVAALAVGVCGAPRAGAAELVELVRALNGLQGDLAKGVSTARAEIPTQIERIEKSVATLEADAWKVRGNARAAAIFLLCGGNARAIRKIAEAHLLPEEDMPLVSGSLAYAEGQSREAARLLSPIDPKTQPVTLGGHLALIQGGLLIGSDNARARELLDIARLLMPSSLVEEAALRREISIVDPLQETSKFLLLGRRYVSQYARSPYARNFWNEARAVTLRVAPSMTEQKLDEFLALFDATSAATRFDLYMTIAREAILHGRPERAVGLARRAEPVAETRPARARIELYRAAIATLGGEFENAAERIEAIEARHLSSADAELREIVTATMQRLRPASESEARESAAPAGAQETQQSTESSVVKSARQSLAESDAVLQRAIRR